jgi:hypothetical protein
MPKNHQNPKNKQITIQPKESQMKTILTLTVATIMGVCTASATINGFVQLVTSSASYTVPSSNILVLQEISLGGSGGYLYISFNGLNVGFPSATNGLYVLPKALLLPGGTTIGGSLGGALLFGVLIAPSDAPLFVGGGSSLGGVTIAADTMTGILQLSGTAVGSKVFFQSSTNLVDWGYDTSVVVQHGSDNTKWQFTTPITGQQRFYRALVRRKCVG